MNIFQKTHSFDTQGACLMNITSSIEQWVNQTNVKNGVLTLFLKHTSASLIIQENADPSVLDDIQSFFNRLVSRDPALYRHGAEGPDDMPAHIRTLLTQTSISIPIENGHLGLGTWQGIYLFEHRDQPHRRNIQSTLIGE